MKTCNKCHIEKDLSEFNKAPKGKDGLKATCRVCEKEYYKNNKHIILAKQKIWREQNKEYHNSRSRRYYNQNKETVKVKNRLYREKHREKYVSYFKEYYRKNKANQQAYKKEYSKKNRESYNSYIKNRIKTDIHFKLRTSLRKRLLRAIHTNQKSGSAVRDLGCTIEFLKEYLESKFQPGMSWDNWTTNGWHIDHIKPLASFDLTDRKQFLQAAHYTNLQPLWAKENLSKKDNVEDVYAGDNV